MGFVKFPKMDVKTIIPDRLSHQFVSRCVCERRFINETGVSFCYGLFASITSYVARIIKCQTSPFEANMREGS